jgi:D-alanine--poly(phosphoribitol) ligase subunit 1
VSGARAGSQHRETPVPGGRPLGEEAQPRLIHEAVALRAAQRPEALAVVAGDLTLTYAELDAHAEACAAQLSAAGTGPGSVVPVLLSRSVRLVTTLLGILKCGAAYAALDRRWPERRLASLISGLPAPVLAGDALPGAVALPLWAPPQPEPGGPVPPVVRAVPARLPDDGSSPAAVFFTSGTSGVPKGVLSPHRATTRLFRTPGFATFGPGRVMTQAAPVSWDAFSLELWSMLATGGTTAIVESDYLMPRQLRAMIADNGVDTVWLTASLLNLFLDEDPGCFAGLAQVITGGERLSVPHVRAFLDAHPGIALVNGYGPVESCVFATTHRIRPADCDAPSGIPVGRAVPGTRVHLLEGTQPAPPGAVAEICLAGEGLADGYLGDAGATAAVFVVADIDGVPTRLYRTGDLGARDGDGVLHYHGRKDLQVKVAGHRIEPGEIEARTREVPGVRDCVAVPLPGPGGAFTGLALHYTASPDTEPPLEPAALRRSLAAVLPPYMVPHRIHVRDRLPMTPQGKPDRKALAAQPATRS